MRDNYDELLIEKTTFVVRGETFTFVEPGPEILDAFVKIANKAGKNGTKDWELQDEQIKLFLTPESQKQWDEMRKRSITEKPITVRQMNEIYRDLWEVATGRPFPTPEQWVSGPGETEATSTPESTAVKGR